MRRGSAASSEPLWPTYLSATSMADSAISIDGRIGVDVDVRPPQPGELAGPEPAHESGQPHRRPRVGGDGLGDQRLCLVDA